MSEARREHWDAAYAGGDGDRSWFQEQAQPSLRAIDEIGVDDDDPIIDVGGGSSRLVDGLLARGLRDVTVLDVSPVALGIAQERLGVGAGSVTWLVDELLTWRPRRSYAVWHDRAVLHFLTTDEERAAYSRAVNAAVRPGGHAILAAFAPDGPHRRSGLPVQRHDADSLAAVLGPGWSRVSTRAQTHRTPNGAAQQFTWATFRRDA